MAQAVGFPVLQSKLQVRVVDAKSGARITSAWIAANESYYWAGFHGSGTECFRAITAFVDPARPDEPIVLPGTSIDSPRWVGSTRHIELFAYRPGYCAAQPYGAASMVGFIKWANEHDPGGLWGTVESPRPGDELAIRMMPAADPPEHRLRHLKIAARVIAGSCYALGGGYLAPMKAAMLAEASQLATTPLEKFLMSEVGAAFDPIDTPRKSLWVPLHGPASSGDVVTLRRMLDQGRTDPFFRSEYTTPGSPYRSKLSLGPNQVTLGTPLNVDDRNEQGLTALMEAARAMQPATAKILLESGADVNMVSGAGGYSALDLVVSRAADDVRESGTEGQEIHLLRMIDLLVKARPAPSLHPRYREELTDPGRWQLGPHLREFWAEVRGRVVGLPARAAMATTCPIEEVARRSLGLDVDRSRARR